MKKVLCTFLLLSFLFVVIPSTSALSRTFQVEPWGFIAGRINLQVEGQTSPFGSVLVDGALNWDNDLGKPIYWAVGASLRRYTFDSFSGPWYGGKLKLSHTNEKMQLHPSLLGGFKWVLAAGFTQEVFVGARLDQPLGGDSPTEVHSFLGYTIGYSF